MLRSQTPEPLCLAGIADEARRVCCHASCGLCGGHGCSAAPGGRFQCCVPAVLSKRRHCNSSRDVSCALPAESRPVKLPSAARAPQPPFKILKGSPGRWQLRNVCAVFDVPGKTPLLSRRGSAGGIIGFSEFTKSFAKSLSVVPASGNSTNRCEQRGEGLGLAVSGANLFHLGFHVVPAFETLQSRAAVLSGVTLVPLLISRGGYFGVNDFLTSPNRNLAWEYAVRALTSAPSATIRADLDRLLSAGCACFDRLVGSTGGFEPYSVDARARWASFSAAVRRNSLLSLGLPTALAAAPASNNSEQAILVTRSEQVQRGRHVANEAAVLARLRTHVATRLVALEAMPVSEQALLIGSAQVFVAAHGAALAWLPFLAARPTATAIEITLPHHELTWQTKRLYELVASALGVHHQAVPSAFANHSCPRAAHHPGAKVAHHSWRVKNVMACAMVADLSAVDTAARVAVDFARRGSPMRVREVEAAYKRWIWPTNLGIVEAAKLGVGNGSSRSAHPGAGVPSFVHPHSKLPAACIPPGRWEMRDACAVYSPSHGQQLFVSRAWAFAAIIAFVPALGSLVGDAPLPTRVATVRPAFLSTELDSCERHATGFIFIAMSNASGPTRVAPSSWLLPLGPLAMGLLPRSSPPSCTCFDHLWGDTSPADEMIMAT